MVRTKSAPISWPPNKLQGKAYNKAVASLPRPLQFESGGHIRLHGNVMASSTGGMGLTFHPTCLHHPAVDWGFGVDDVTFSQDGTIAVAVKHGGGVWSEGLSRFRWVDVATGATLADAHKKIPEGSYPPEFLGHAPNVPGFALMSVNGTLQVITPGETHSVRFWEPNAASESKLRGATLTPDGCCLLMMCHDTDFIRSFIVSTEGLQEMQPIDARPFGTWVDLMLTPAGCGLLGPDCSAELPSWSPPEGYGRPTLSRELPAPQLAGGHLSRELPAQLAGGFLSSELPPVSGWSRRVAYTVLNRVVVRDFNTGATLADAEIKGPIVEDHIEALSFSPCGGFLHIASSTRCLTHLKRMTTWAL